MQKQKQEHPTTLDELKKDRSNVCEVRDSSGKVTVVLGCQDPTFLEHISYSPEVQEELESTRQGLNLVIDLNAKRIWRGDRDLEPVHHCQDLLDDLHAIASFPKRLLTDDGLKSPYVVVVLGAGKGTRMGDWEKQKVCSEIGTRSATERALQIYERAGFAEHILVVGHRSDLVVQHIAAVKPNTTFVLQPNLLGTGHAARQAMYLLEAQGFTGNVLIVAGDKVVDPDVLFRLRMEFERSDADLMLVCAPKERWPSGGHVLLNANGRVEAVIESLDIKKMSLLERMQREMKDRKSLRTADLHQWVFHEVPNVKKVLKMFGPDFLQRLDNSQPISEDELESLVNFEEATFKRVHSDGKVERLTWKQVEDSCNLVNVSFYLFKAEAFYHAVRQIQNDNAQKEYYLTDIFEILCQNDVSSGGHRFKLLPLALDDPEQVLGFNTDQELEYILNYIRRTTIVRLRERGVVVDLSAESSEAFWVDDLDSVEKIGEGTLLLGDAVIDLGPDPNHRIGKNCVIDGVSVIRTSVPDGTVLRNVES